MAMFYGRPSRADVADGLSAKADPLAARHHEVRRDDQRRAEFRLRPVHRQDHRRPARRPRPELAGRSPSTAPSRCGPIRCARFTERFAPYGFRPETHYPCYGMAETTLIVTGSYKGRPQDHPHVRRPPARRASRSCRSKAEQPEARRAGRLRARAARRAGADRRSRYAPRAAAGSDRRDLGQQPQRGPGLLEQRARRPSRRFRRGSPATDEGPFLRTGDLGFLHDGELFVTGRLKDLIIVRGVNRYPQDIEMTVERASARIQPQAVGAFAVDLAGRERLIIVAEVERTRRDDWSRRDRRRSQGRDRRARTAARCGRAGAVRLDSQDLQRQDSAACLPRRVSEPARCRSWRSGGPGKAGEEAPSGRPQRQPHGRRRRPDERQKPSSARRSRRS